MIILGHCQTRGNRPGVLDVWCQNRPAKGIPTPGLYTSWSRQTHSRASAVGGQPGT